MTTPDAYRDATLSLTDLVAAAEALLSHAPRPGDARVAPFPDARTVRYYQSMGVLDRPDRYEGRQAIYGYRHLLQAVCVKLLQGQGYSLAQIQRSLAGAPTERLERAVYDALDAGPPTPPIKPETEPRSLIAAEIAPGVHVTVDPAVISDPAAVLATLTRALAHASGAPS